jgi:hypothetical protein
LLFADQTYAFPSPAPARNLSPGRWPDTSSDTKRKWAIVRLSLGQAQIVAATITLYFLIATRDSPYTIWSAIVTALISGASVYLFKIRKKQDS